MCAAFADPYHPSCRHHRLYNMCVQIGSIIATQIYREDDKKSGYYKGNRILIGIAVFNVFLISGVKGAPAPPSPST